MEYLPEAIDLTLEQIMRARVEQASHQKGYEELAKHAGRIWASGDIGVRVQYNGDYDDHSYVVATPGTEVIVNPDNIMVKSNGELVTDPEDRFSQLGRVATQLRNTLELAGSPELTLAA